MTPTSRFIGPSKCRVLMELVCTRHFPVLCLFLCSGINFLRVCRACDLLCCICWDTTQLTRFVSFEDFGMQLHMQLSCPGSIQYLLLAN